MSTLPENEWKVVTLRKNKPQGKIIKASGPISCQPVKVGGNIIRIAKENVRTIVKADSGNKYNRPTLSTFKKLDEAEDVGEMKKVLVMVSKTLGKKIVQARTNKDWTRGQLAAAINERVNVVSGFENSNCQFSQPILTKINKALSTTLKRTD